MLLAIGTVAATAECMPGAIGTSRQIQIDATGAPRFGHLQYPGPELLKPGEVVLTFDDGPHRQYTRTILDVLSQHCARATFFMVGQRALGYADMVQEVARRGHTVGTHTWSHANLKQQSQDGAVNEIELGISAVQKALGAQAAPFFRFPYLADPANAIGHLKSRNTAIFSIDVDSYDFRTRSPTVVMRNVMSQLKTKGRGIILFHDIQPSTAGALGSLLSDLKAGGYRIVHLVPTRGQVTVAQFDQKVGAPTRNVAALSAPVRQRTIVAPAWEPRTLPAQADARGQYPVPAAQSIAQPQPQVAAAGIQPRPVAPLRPSIRGGDDDDWKKSVFRPW